MKKQGFTLVELIVSIVLVGIVLASMIGTLLSLKNTYNVINEDMEARTYSALVSKVINEYIMKNNGIKDYDCAGNKCVMTLGTLDKNGHNKKMTLEIVTATLKSNVMKDNKNNSDVGSLMEKTTTIKYYGEDYSYYKTLKYYDRHYTEGNKDVITGYKFEDIIGIGHIYSKPDTYLKDYLVNITIRMNNPKYNIEIYSTSEVKETDVGNIRLHRLTYNSNGGSTCSDNPKVALDRKPWGELCLPEKLYNGFKGWFIQKDGVFTKEVTAESIALEDLDVYAHWDANKYSCPAGKYLPAGKTSCETCLENNYCPGITDVYYDKFHDQGITKCYIGYSSNVGSTKETDCKIKCEANTYMQGKYNSSCTACPNEYISSEHYVEQGKTSECILKVPNKPIISSTDSEVVYNKKDITLTCTEETEYGSNITKLYQFGYATSLTNYNSGNITWIGNPSTTNTYKVSKTEYVGERYYICRTGLQVTPIPKYNCKKNAEISSVSCEKEAKVASRTCRTSATMKYTCRGGNSVITDDCTKVWTDGGNAQNASCPSGYNQTDQEDGWINCCRKICASDGLYNEGACYLYNMSSCPSGYSSTGSSYSCPVGSTSCDVNYCCKESTNACSGVWTEKAVKYTCSDIGGELCKTNKCCKNEFSSCGSWTTTGTTYSCSGVGGSLCETSKCCNNGVTDQLSGWNCTATGEYTCPKNGSYNGTYSSGKCTYPNASDYGKNHESQNYSLVKIKNIKITFDKNTGEINPTTGSWYTRSGANVFYNGELSSTTKSAPTASKKGHTWNGWFKEASGNDKILDSNNVLQNSEISGYIKSGKWTTIVDRKLYAQYSANTYNLTFNCNGGSKVNGKPADTSVVYGTKYTLTSDVCTKTGYTQNGWNRDSTKTTPTWTTENTVDWVWNIDENVILYAIWRDTTRPVCKFSSAPSIIYKSTGKVELTCTDNDSINSQTLSASNFTTSDSSVVTITNVSAPVAVAGGGYKYTVTLSGEGAGSYTVSLKESAIEDVAGNKNKAVNLTGNITKYTPSLALSATSGSVDANSTNTFTATPTTISSCQGTLTAASTDTTKVTITGGASYSNVASGTAKTVTYKGIAYTDGTKINVNYSPTDTNNCNSASQKQFSASVAKINNSITINCASLTYSGSAQQLINSVTVSGGTPYYKIGTELTSSNYSSTGTTDKTAITGKNATSYTIYYYVPTTDVYKELKGSKSCSIAKYKPSIALSAATGTVDYNASTTFNATPTTISNCQGTLTAASANTSYVSITGGASNSNVASGTAKTITWKGVGYTTGTNINVNYAPTDTDNCNSATQVQYTAKVNKVAGTFSCSNKTYNGTEQTACTCTGGTMSNHKKTNAGTYTATCTADANHTLSTTSIEWKMNKYTPSITLSAATGTVDYNASTTFNATPTTISNCQGTLTAASANTSYVNITGGASNSNVASGTAKTITWNGVGYTTGTNINVNYTPTDTNNCNSASQKQYSAKVNKVDATCPTVTAYSGTYDGNSHTVTVSGGSGGTIKYEKSIDNGSTYTDQGTTNPVRVSVGTTYVKVRVVGDANHNNVTCDTKTIKISQRTVTVTAPTVNSSTLTYSGSAQNLLATSGSCTAGGTMYWWSSNPSTSQTTAPSFSTSSGWTTTAPSSTSYKGTNAGTYYMWYYCYVSDTDNNTGTNINTAKSVTKAIGKATTNLSLSSSSGTLTVGTNGTVTINTNGDGALSCSSAATATATCSISGKTLTITPKSAGTTNITVSQAEGTNYKKPSKNEVYVATVKNNTYTVSFDRNCPVGGSGGQTADKTATFGQAMPAINTTAPTCPGMTFGGWENLSETLYYNSAGASQRNYDVASDMTLYGKWTGKSYKLRGVSGKMDTTLSKNDYAESVSAITGGYNLHSKKNYGGARTKSGIFEKDRSYIVLFDLQKTDKKLVNIRGDVTGATVTAFSINGTAISNPDDSFKSRSGDKNVEDDTTVYHVKVEFQSTANSTVFHIEPNRAIETEIKANITNIRIYEMFKTNIGTKAYNTLYTDTNLTTIIRDGYVHLGWFGSNNLTNELNTSKHFNLNNAEFEDINTANKDAYIFANVLSESSAPTYCTLEATKNGVQWKKIKADSYQIDKSSSVPSSYDNKNSKSLSNGTFYGHTKSNSGVTYTCSIQIKEKELDGYNCTATGTAKESCDSAYSSQSGCEATAGYHYSNGKCCRTYYECPNGTTQSTSYCSYHISSGSCSAGYGKRDHYVCPNGFESIDGALYCYK